MARSDRVLRHTVVDTMFSVDLARFAAGTFLEPNTVMAVSENKSYVVLRENDKADAAANYRYFLASFDKFDEVSRSRLTTVRAKMMYVMSAAFDPATDSIYTITVPNAKVRRLVVSRFDRRDMTLSEEFTPALAPGSGLAFKVKDGSLDAFYVSGAAFHEGRLYAISAAFGTLLTIDPQARTVVAAHSIPGLERPVGLAIRGLRGLHRRRLRPPHRRQLGSGPVAQLDDRTYAWRQHAGHRSASLLALGAAAAVVGFSPSPQAASHAASQEKEPPGRVRVPERVVHGALRGADALREGQEARGALQADSRLSERHAVHQDVLRVDDRQAGLGARVGHAREVTGPPAWRLPW